jgi:hypothetical protein
MNEDQLETHEPGAFEEAEALEAQDADPGSGRSGSKILVVAVVVVAIAIAATGWMLGHPRAVLFTSTYQAVTLVNGQVFFGRLEGYGTSNPVLSEVYYVQSTINPQTKQQSNILTKRGKDWHGPDRMYINPQQIVIVEPVNPDSRVGELIKELKMQR